MTRYAETWLDVGRLPLRRRDRAAMVLALECLRAKPRGGRVGRAYDALRLGGRVPRAIAKAIPYSSLLPLGTGARLALLLRVLLRADEGDFGALECDCEEPVPLNYVGHSQAWCNGCRCWTDMIAPVRPLWEAAR